jgi:glucose/mannose transport system permease protein
MAMFLAGLRSIPDELKEAAQVDGANAAQAFRYVSVPLLRPILLSAIIILGHILLGRHFTRGPLAGALKG